MLLYIVFSTIVIAVEGQKCSNGKLTPDQRIQMVKQHNRYRSRLIRGKFENKDGKSMPQGKDMLKMRWNCTLERSAQKWANTCPIGYFPKYTESGIGENIFSYQFIYTKAFEHYLKNFGRVAIEVWWEEVWTNYPNNPSNKFTSKIPIKAMNFTQMAWGETHQVGCGIATHCNDGSRVMVVCHYWPAGNIENKLIYKLGEPCKKDSDCSSKKCFVRAGLCKI